ncbi:MAG: BTAD domain-containing putative transcriptional regulator [Caldilineaceae bacterium]
MSLELLFFGAFQVLRQGNPITSCRSVNVQGLMAYLALESDRPHSREHLSALFWPNEPDNIAKQNLRQILYLLKQSLGEDPGAQPYLLTARATVQFNPHSVYTLDVAQFDAALAAEDHVGAAGWYRGDLLAGLYCESTLFEEWLVTQRERRHQQALGLFHRLAETHLAREDYAQASNYAYRQLEMEPWREAAHRQIMTALSAQGDRTGALSQYERCRKMLLDHLGVEPDPETEALYDAIRIGTKSGSPTNASLPAAVPSHSLPPTLTPLIGRNKEVHAIVKLLQGGARVVTILGEGGIGKTRLALTVGEDLAANAFADGVRFVPLAGVVEDKHTAQPSAALQDDALLMAIAGACGVAFAGDEPLRQRLYHHLQPRHMLLVLDNFEHLVASAALLLTLLEHATTAVDPCHLTGAAERLG